MWPGLSRRMQESGFTVVFLAVGVALVSVGSGLRYGAFPGDLLFALKTGKWVVVHHAVPVVDPFSWTEAGKPWVAHEWLWDAIAWGLWRIAGWRGIEALVLTAVAALFLGLRRFALALGAGRSFAWLAPAMAMLLSYASFQPRPQTAGYALFAWTLVWAFAGEWRAGTWAGVAVAGTLWANLHGGSAFLGPGALAASALEAWLDGERERSRRNLGGAALMAVAELLNPYGPRLWAFTWDLALNPSWSSVRSHISEWRPPAGSDAAVLIIMGFYLLGTIWVAKRRPMGMALMTVVFVLASLMAWRNMPYAAFWLAGAAGNVMAGKTRWRGMGLLVAGAAAAGFLVSGVTQVVNTGVFLPCSQDLSMLRAAQETVRWERSHGETCANDYNLGNYLLWIGARPWIDGRADLYVQGGVFERQMEWMAGLADPGSECVAVSQAYARTYAPGIERLRLEGWKETRLDYVSIFEKQKQGKPD